MMIICNNVYEYSTNLERRLMYLDRTKYIHDFQFKGLIMTVDITINVNAPLSGYCACFSRCASQGLFSCCTHAYRSIHQGLVKLRPYTPQLKRLEQSYVYNV